MPSEDMGKGTGQIKQILWSSRRRVNDGEGAVAIDTPRRLL